MFDDGLTRSDDDSEAASSPRTHMATPTVINPPERIALRTLTHDVVFEGPSALLLPNGSLRCGSAADAALDEYSPRTPASSARGGLLMIQSHRQRLADFELFARMLDVIHAIPAGGIKPSKVIPRNQSASILDDLSLLIVNNNAVDQTNNWASTDHPVQWLHRFTLPTLRLRMLLLTAVNLGYSCGGMHLVAAMSRILARFPWVMCVSGPDSLLTPWGAFRLSGMIFEDKLWRPGARVGTHTLFADRFVNMNTQLSNDIFVYIPPTRAPAESMHRLWSSITEHCLRLVSHLYNMPEPLLFTASRVHHMNVSTIGHTYLCTGLDKGCFDWAKRFSQRPLRHSASWHSHNATLIRAWLAETEAGLHMVRPENDTTVVTGHSDRLARRPQPTSAPVETCTLSADDKMVWCASQGKGGLGRC